MCLIPPAEEEIVLGNGKNLEMLLERGGYLLVLLQEAFAHQAEHGACHHMPVAAMALLD